MGGELNQERPAPPYEKRSMKLEDAMMESTKIEFWQNSRYVIFFAKNSKTL